PPPVAPAETTEELVEEDDEELVTERPPSDRDYSPDNGGPTLGEQVAMEGSDLVDDDEIYDADDLLEPTPEEAIEFDQPVLPAKGPPTVSSIDFAAAIRPDAEPLAATDRVAAEEIESSRPEESSASFRAPRPRVPPPPPPRGAPPRVPPPPPGPPRPPVAPPRPEPPRSSPSRPVAPPREELDTIDLGEDRDTTVGPLGDAVVMAIPHEFSDVARGPELVTEAGAKLGDTSFDPDAPHGEAVQLMVHAGEREAWVERARWLYSEAPADPQSRADTLLVVSEILSMAGEDEQAELVAREALGLAPSSPLAHRQLRSLLMARDRWIEVCDALDAEARVAPTPLAKLHALYLSSEVSRLVLGDAEAAGRRLDHAERALGDDVRPQLARLMRALASSDEVPEASFRGEAAEPFTRALDALRNVRSDGAEGRGDDTPHALLLQARGALRRRDVARTIGALADLQATELAPGVAWLTAALAAPHRELRGTAVEALTRVSEGSHGPLAMRALATRALEAGDLESAFRVVANAAEEVLAPAERLAIASLNGRTLMDLQTLLEEALAAGEYAPLAAAASAVLVSPMSGSSSIRTVGEPLQRAQVSLGRELAACALGSTTQRISRNEVLDAQPLDSSVEEGISPALRHRASEVTEIDPSNGAARAVLLEDAYASRDVARVAKAVLESSETAGGLERERALASALLSEIGGDSAQMVADAQRALEVGADDEAAARMVAAGADPVVGAAGLVRFGEATSDVARSALAFTEAGLRLMEVEGEEFEGESLLRRAAGAQADIPIAAFIGMYVTRAMGDAEGEAFWLEQRRAASHEAVDRVPDLIRQALALPAEDSATRGSLLEEAHRARPYDYTLRELYEQTAGEVEDRPRWLMDQATQGVVGAAAMALEAAYAHELAGDLEHAAEAAGRAVSGGDRLAPVFAERYALSGHGADTVFESLLERLRQTKDDAERCDLRMLIGRIELARGHWSQALDAFRAVANEAPDDLIAL
ncbi:MAG TPA: hypothetical protein VFB62_06580, partial [Polyangiaceae bacterium]|nr:hypothetical protein [Polyangiaceae bacterium]